MRATRNMNMRIWEIWGRLWTKNMRDFEGEKWRRQMLMWRCGKERSWDHCCKSRSCRNKTPQPCFHWCGFRIPQRTSSCAMSSLATSRAVDLDWILWNKSQIRRPSSTVETFLPLSRCNTWSASGPACFPLHKAQRHKRGRAIQVFSSLSISIPSATPSFQLGGVCSCHKVAAGCQTGGWLITLLMQNFPLSHQRWKSSNSHHGSSSCGSSDIFYTLIAFASLLCGIIFCLPFI